MNLKKFNTLGLIALFIIQLYFD